MFEVVLKIFDGKIEDKSDVDRLLMLEIASRQLNGFISSSVGFAFISSKEVLKDSKRFDTVIKTTKLTSKVLRVASDNLGTDSKKISAFNNALEIENVDLIKLPYSEGRPYGYTLSKTHLLTLLSCFLDQADKLIEFKNNSNKPLSHNKKFTNQNGKPQSILTIHDKLFDKLVFSRINLPSARQHVENLIKNSISQGLSKTIINAFRAISVLSSVVQQKPRQIGPLPLYDYTPAYKITGSNNPRPYDQLGLQSAKNEFLKQSLVAVSHSNQDIKSSNMNMLEKLLRDAGIDSGWFIEYLKTPDLYKSNLAKTLNATNDQVKTALQAITNGAPFIYNKDVAIAQAFHSSDEKETKDKCEKFLKEMSPIKKPMLSLKLMVMTGSCWKYGKRHRNALGQAYNFASDQFKSRAERKKLRAENKQAYNNKPIKLPREKGRFGQRLSFLVTGLEQKFISHLILSLPINNPVYVLKHDGFISKLQVSQAQIDDAKKACDLPYLEFVEKDI